MRVLGLDFETTGLDTATARITEIGAVLWDVEAKFPLTTLGAFLHDATYPPQSTEIIKLTGITDTMLLEFGTPPAASLRQLDDFCAEHQVEYIVAHNGENFDKPLLMSELARHSIATRCLRNIPWIDSRTDLPFESEPDSRKLKHLAGDYGFINPFAHRALFDVMTMLRVLSQFPMASILEYQKIPFRVLRAAVSYDQKELAKQRRFSWEKIGEQTWPKFWVKKVKENVMDAEIVACKLAGFDAIRIE